jgi:TPR repeat protein
MYNQGHGVPQDYAQAAVWYRKAAERGDADAEEGLGELYRNGQGVPQDYAQAYFWLDLAADDRLDAPAAKDASQNRDSAASVLAPADLSAAQQRARKWFEDHPAKVQ